ncbi:methylated-DNA--[protein]-cysteine S-methyltransferase [Sphingobacterium bovistauri]|uniref:Methylated-DNA--[protein]-cysteine S-methyltransferase n=1 Tax=Sphingobacterium bovistauri TaxID=2781959 RepID=A0ABS7Z929_9SPHI|nr:methylated-DNA--[protein]-cysteine S-methyltransferase [Sphingobacterium bovistauri]MCA5006077.1 methylated-DNA--[protein]-cysteine S-methyltransferase [Sphingobacterium bovistauri]
MSQQQLNYERIAKAIAFIQANFKQQPSLEEIAAHISLSPFHFQRLFQDWAGTTPKKFLQYISLQHAKKILQVSKSTEIATFETGLSSSSRLHELFVKIEHMSPAEYKNGGVSLQINYSIQHTPFGPLCVASTTKGICHLAFIENKEEAVTSIKLHYPNATIRHQEEEIHNKIDKIFSDISSIPSPLSLHLKGTPFQLKVWEALLKIPKGQLRTYSDIALHIGNPKASRAVGTAIGSNPIAFLIPCHRVIQTSGLFGGYMWGATRKTAIIGWENANLNTESDETI